MPDDTLAVHGGSPVRKQPWPKWPRATRSECDVLAEVLNSSRWTVSGPFDGRVCFERQFAAAFARYHQVPFCTPTASGTAALTIALEALGIGRGQEVLVPGLTWVACASAVLSVGAVPVLVDIDPVTLTMSPEQARAACTDRTAAILLVHLFCSIGDLDAFTALAEERGIALIEDCAQAHGARWRNRPVGTFGLIGCFSMQQSKLLTSGEGGAAITGDEALYDRLEQLRCDGRRFGRHPEPGRLELVEVATVQGRNLCLSEFQAALLLTGLRRLDEENQTRERAARRLHALLAAADGVATLPADPRVTNRTYYNYVFRIDPDAFAGSTVDAVARAVSAELGTMVSPVYVPLNRHPLLCPGRAAGTGLTREELARLDPRQFALPEAEEARRTCLTVTHPVLLGGEAAMDDVAAAFGKVQRRAQDLLVVPQEASAWAF
jgi:dTDP-4-amino-4,6-dideoxygalactose transaminase